MKRRGQFFLASAFVIIGVLIGLTSVANFVVVGGDKEYFYDLSKEVGFETKRVMDYGALNTEEGEVIELTSDFIYEYSDYIGQDKVLFIFGDENNLRGLYFQENSVGSIGLSTGGEPTRVAVQRTSGSEAEVSVANGFVNVEIEGALHRFKIREGTNLFYVLIKEDGDEILVAEG